MQITAIKTKKIKPGDADLFSLLDESLPVLQEGDIVTVTSKIVSLCEGSYMPIDQTDKKDLVKRQADYVLPAEHSRYGQTFTITNHTLVAVAGIDESNGSGCYVFWPNDVQRSANEIRAHLRNKHGIKKLGIIITDSTSYPMRLGTIGIALAHSGFKALKDYVGTPDLFGRPISVSRANLAGGLSAAAVVVMGEGREQTPLALVRHAGFIDFCEQDPDEKELEGMRLQLEDDLFAPFLNSVPWQEPKES